MPGVVVLGAQWGDEGKGKVVDLLTPYADAVVRYGGGANAGHTLVVGDRRVVLHLLPSGALHANAVCVLGQGMVIDPHTLLEELQSVHPAVGGAWSADRLRISDRAHVVLPQHRLVDGLRDCGAAALGTTRRGIGPAYEDKVGRRGIRIGDLLQPAILEQRLRHNLETWRPVLRALGGQEPELAATMDACLRAGEQLAPFVGDTSRWLHQALAQGQKVLFEGAQGTLLDVEMGTYPYVTSSSVLAAAAATGAGISPFWLDGSIGIVKAYTTRVGEGPFPTELFGDAGEQLRRQGKEFGSTTGRPRRCGWLDAAALRYAVRVNGMRELALTKLDVLSGLDELRIGTGYRFQGQLLDEPPYDGLGDVEVVYETLPGWQADLSACRNSDDLPAAARTYVQRIEQLVDCPVQLISLGADRDATFGLRDPFLSSI